MRGAYVIRPLILAGLLALVFCVACWAGDYNSRFVRNYPPGFHGMWYEAERFFEKDPQEQEVGELYRWDKYMMKLTGVHYPFLPIPFMWDYGNARTFNLPDYNSNDWP